MKFLFLVGVEGSGHAMTRSLLSSIIGQPYFSDQGDLHWRMMDFWDQDATGKEREKAKAKIEKAIVKYGKAGYTHILETASFPYNQPRNALRRYDLIEFYEFLRGKLDIRLLVTYRNPISATYSSVRRGICKHPYLQCKIVEDNYIYINAQLACLPEEIYRVLVFEEFLANPSRYVKPLADWWGLGEASLQEGLNHLKSPTSPEGIPGKKKKFLEEFFTELRVKQWPILVSEKYRLA